MSHPPPNFLLRSIPSLLLILFILIHSSFSEDKQSAQATPTNTSTTPTNATPAIKKNKTDYLQYSKHFLQDKLHESNKVTEQYFMNLDKIYEAPRKENETCKMTLKDTYEFARAVEFYWGRTDEELLPLYKKRNNGSEDPKYLIRMDPAVVFTGILMPCDIRDGLVCFVEDIEQVHDDGRCTKCENLHAEDLSFTGNGTRHQHIDKDTNQLISLNDTCVLVPFILKGNRSHEVKREKALNGAGGGYIGMKDVVILSSLGIISTFFGY